MPKKMVQIPGSERQALPGATISGNIDPTEQIEVTVRLRANQPIDKQKLFDIGRRKPAERRHMTREEYEADHGANPDDLAKIQAFARENGLTVGDVSREERKVVLSGSVQAFSKAFNVELKEFQHKTGRYRGRTGPIHLPEDLVPIVEGVFGLDNRPQAKPHHRRAKPKAAGQVPSSFPPPQVGALYDFPSTVNGSGQTIGIIELGGGYQASDLPAYFQGLGLRPPSVQSVSVDGANGKPGVDSNADGEVMLDIEVAGAIAPGANLVVYFAPNTDRGFLDAVTAAIHDRTHTPSVISISWGSAESGWSAQAMQAMDQAFQAAGALGVTVCVAAGDDGSSDGVSDGQNHVDFPASSPHVLGCGGTRLEGSGKTITSEVVWNDGPGNGATGGGVSGQFGAQDWQKNARVPNNGSGQPGRGVPDVAGDADPQSGYQVVVDGQATVIGGTSAVAPLWAGLIALINQELGKPVGYLNPLLYTLPAACFHDITLGDNGSYKAGPGWDPCTGLGSPDGAALLSAMKA